MGKRRVNTKGRRRVKRKPARKHKCTCRKIPQKGGFFFNMFTPEYKQHRLNKFLVPELINTSKQIDRSQQHLQQQQQ